MNGNAGRVVRSVAFSDDCSGRCAGSVETGQILSAGRLALAGLPPSRGPLHARSLSASIIYMCVGPATSEVHKLYRTTIQNRARNKGIQNHAISQTIRRVCSGSTGPLCSNDQQWCSPGASGNTHKDFWTRVSNAGLLPKGVLTVLARCEQKATTAATWLCY